MIGISSIKKAATVPASTRNRKNRAFLFVCLAFTSISVLCLAPLPPGPQIQELPANAPKQLARGV